MKNFPRRKIFSTIAKGWFALLALLALPLNTPAQPSRPERWLFVFDLSSAMKKRLPATEQVLTNFFATGAEGRLQNGDNIGVWTYDQKTHGGQFPLAIWKPEQATELMSNLTVFLNSRKYAMSSQLAALQPALAGVITNSERLTIVIFCDGESDITATPYDAGINQSFLDGRAEQKKSSQPFVVLIRTLSGKYIGCTVSFPPGAINIPLFLAPPPPVNIPPPPPLVVAPIKPPPVVVPDLVIIGTKVGPSAIAVEPPAPPKTNALVRALPKTAAVPDAVPVPATVVMPPATNQVAAKTEIPLAAPVTPVAVAAPEKHKSVLLYVGAGILAVVFAVVILVVRLGRRTESSLITSSMQDDPRRK